MEPRRLSGLLALIVVFFGLAVLVYFEFRPRPPVPAQPVAVAVEPPSAPAASAPAATAAAPEAPATPAAEAPAAAPPAETASSSTPVPAEAPAPAASVETAPPPTSATAETPATAETAPQPGDAPPATADSSAAPPPGTAATAPAASEPATGEPAQPAETAVASAAPPAAAEAAPPAGTGEVEIAVVTTPPAAPDGAAAPPVGGVETVAPSFDIVRVEPTGDAVVAGQAAPGATVELLDGDSTVATAEANERGEWAISLEAPLAPGAHDLAVRTTSKDKATVTLSDQRIAVSVPEKAGEEALVVLNTPDAASTVLQLPAVEKAPEAAPAEAPGAVAVAGEAAGGMAGGSAAGTTAVVEAPSAEGGTAMGTTAGEGAPGTAAAGAAPGEKDVAAVAPSPEPAASREAPAAGAAESAAAPAEAPAATPAVEEPKVEPEVALTAVEADTGGTLYVAGIAKTPETVRVYLDDQVLGEATPSPSGTWLLEVKRELPAGRYAVRADQVDRLGAVIVRAEVPFERELEVASLRPVAATGESAGAAVSGAMPALQTVIIKRGDNLWRISRAMYGKGIRFSTIYQANRDQIRNARWIYPGQVFVVPTGDTTWTE